jgi:DNA primase
MTLSPQWLDDLRARTILSSLIGKSLKLTKKGGEFTGCCPFHHEKTPSFTVSDAKGFYHCFGCGAHGDAIRWLTDGQGMAFMDAVKDLAALAGMDVPAPSPEVAKRDGQVSGAAAVLDRAAAWYAKQLQAAADVQAMLAERGISQASIDKFQLGFAPAKKGVAACGASPADLVQVGLLKEDERSGAFRDFFRAGEPKYINSPDSDHFNKGDLLFNLHRAAPAARSARRLIIVEGQFDVVGLDQVGIPEATAPMGTALTEKQLERAWRVAHCPILLFDGDAAGRKAALRAAERAMPFVGPGASLKIAQLPDGEDPDSLARSGGKEAVEAVIDAAAPLAEWLFNTLLAAAA